MLGRARRRSALAVSLAAVAAVAAPAASAAPGLPRTYQVQVIENPTPGLGDRFGDGMVVLGDVNNDAKDDLLVGIDEHGTVSGELFVFSGADGSQLLHIPPPDPDAGGDGDNRDAFGTYVGRIADIGGCPNFTGNPGENCGPTTTSPSATQPEIDTPDGKPDILASAVGVDVDADGDDMGMVYVIDGVTGAVLKRIVMPAGDRAEQLQNQPTASQGGAFGRTVLSPSGQTPCVGFAGVDTSCTYTAGSFVARGDIDGGGRPDIGVGASDYTDKTGGTSDTAAENPVCTATCNQAGRFYMYRGEQLVGLPASTPLDASYYKLKNPFAEDDTALVSPRFAREAMGYSVAPIGDIGKCAANTAPVAATDAPSAYLCTTGANRNVPDTFPDLVVSSHRSDSFGMGDSGLAYLIDGRTGRILELQRPVEPQQSAIFGFSNYNQPAPGDMGGTTLPDVYHGAMVQDVTYRAQGRGWVINGDVGTNANNYAISVLDDPTPAPIGNFSTSSAGVGNLAGDFHKELLIGAYGPHAPQVVNDVVNDVHFFDATHGTPLQTISDPANQEEAGFGRALAPLGDLNGDGFLDFAVGSGGYGGGTCSPCTPSDPAQGRVYIFRSDNSPAPPAPPPPDNSGPAGPTGPAGPAGPEGPAAAPAVVLAGRTAELDVSKSRIRRGASVRLAGFVDSLTADTSCQSGQRVLLQRRRPGATRYATFTTTKTSSRGVFSRTIRPVRTYYYRAIVEQSAACLATRSNRERVTVLAARGSSTR